MSDIWVPKSYQSFLFGKGITLRRCAFWAGMGTGKTSTAATVIDYRMLQGDVQKTLIIAPKLVAASTWPDELRRWGHLNGLRFSAILGTPYQRHQALAADADVYSINYENIPWLIETCGMGQRWPFQMVIADESQKLKSHRCNNGSVRAQALSYIAGKTRYWINLTGTPTPNGLIDLWGQQWFIDGGARLGKTFTAFASRWFFEDERARKYRPYDFAFEQITSLLNDVCFSVQAKDFIDLPPLIEKTVWFDLPAKARRHYDELEKVMFTEFQAGRVDIFNEASLMGKLRQVSTGACYIDKERAQWENVHDEKLDALQDVIDEAAGMPVLVAYWFKHDLVKLKKRFPQGVAMDKSVATIDRWNKGEIPLLFIHPGSAGHGLNLQHGSNIICYYSIDWSHELHAQVLERIGPTRQAQSGYNRPVHKIVLAARDTVDEQILDSLAGKLDVENAVMARMKKKGLA